MDSLTLLRETHDAGLQVRADGEQLMVRGPKRLATLVQQLLSHKETILTLLEQWEERAAIAEYNGGLSRADAERLAWESFVGKEL